MGQSSTKRETSNVLRLDLIRSASAPIVVVVHARSQFFVDFGPSQSQTGLVR